MNEWLRISMIAGLFAWNSTGLAFAQQSGDVVYNRDVRPILSDNCFLCHGNDSSSRQAGLRLDSFDAATAMTDSGVRPIVPGKPDESELFRRITSVDEFERMPPADSHKKALTPEQIATIRQWIQSGAEYQPHWAFITPKRPEVPNVKSEELDPTAWCRGPIDHFVLRRMLEHGMQPTVEASRERLIRRVTLDLTGLPPDLASVDAFLNDDSPLAYENLVDRLLESPAFGEHMARFWLDAVRYADTHGLHFDNYREVWPYRDWVVRSFNNNLPFDQFAIKQLAGDLLPEPSLDDLIASGYNRLHVTTNEGGSIQEEVFNRNVVDRVSTTGTVFMGLTLGCAVCHDHKYDPISAEDFYSFYAFFNSLEDEPLDKNIKSPAPVISVMGAEDEHQLAAIDDRIAAATAVMDTPQPELAERQAEWMKTVRAVWGENWFVPENIVATSLGGASVENSGDESGRFRVSGTNPKTDTFEIVSTVTDQPVTMLRLEVFPDADRLKVGGGRSPNGNAVLTELRLLARRAGSGQEYEEVRLAAAVADYSQEKFTVAMAIDREVGGTNGWAIDGHNRNDQRTAVFVLGEPLPNGEELELKVVLEFKSMFAQHAFSNFRVSFSDNELVRPLVMSDWHLAGPFVEEDREKALSENYGAEPGNQLRQSGIFSSDYETVGEPKAGWTRRTDFPDGAINLFSTEMGAWYLHRTFWPVGDRLRISLGSDDAVAVWVNGVEVHRNNVARGAKADQDILNVKVNPGDRNDVLIKVVNFGGASGFYFSATDSGRSAFELFPILIRDESGWTTEERTRIARVFLFNASPVFRETVAIVEKLEQDREELLANRPTTLVARESAMPRPAYVLVRGEYDKPDIERGELQRRVPAWLPPMEESLPKNRLGLAKWLVSDEHPLLARVTVNRFWQQIFGRGLVATAEDFGSQGTWPEHPQLLDWLAVDFRESGWDVKRLMRQMVLSASYRQDSAANAELWKTDPGNRWMARGPRNRLDAETLRDQMLSVSGLLVKEIGGPGTRPPQPDGIWNAVAYVGSNTQFYEPDREHEKIHRRSLYMFWKRTAPPPQFSTFDAPTREECVIRRERTNTPLQALLLLNDPQYVEGAVALAARVLEPVGKLVEEEQIAGKMFRMATLREADDGEIGVLVDFYQERLGWYKGNVDAAREFLVAGKMVSEIHPYASTLDIPQWAAWSAVANVILNMDEVVSKQ